MAAAASSATRDGRRAGRGLSDTLAALGGAGALAALLLPLGADTFAVAAAAGLTYRARNQRIRVLLTLCVFEGAMPVIGMLAGRGLALAVAGRAADYAAAACVGLMGVLLLREGAEEVRAETALSLPILMGLGLSVSLDELALGFGAGLLRLPLLTVVVWVAMQACVAVAAGLWLADAVGARLREKLEGLAGVVLLCLAVGLVVVTARG